MGLTREEIMTRYRHAIAIAESDLNAAEEALDEKFEIENKKAQDDAERKRVEAGEEYERLHLILLDKLCRNMRPLNNELERVKAEAEAERDRALAELEKQK